MLLTSVVLSPFAFPVWPMVWSFKTSPLQTSDPTFCISLHSVHNFAFNLTEEIDAIRRYHPLSSCYYIYLSVFVYAPCILIFLYYGVNWPCSGKGYNLHCSLSNSIPSLLHDTRLFSLAHPYALTCLILKNNKTFVDTTSPSNCCSIFLLSFFPPKDML